jgi:hypothetical protein
LELVVANRCIYESSDWSGIAVGVQNIMEFCKITDTNRSDYMLGFNFHSHSHNLGEICLFLLKTRAGYKINGVRDAKIFLTQNAVPFLPQIFYSPPN